MAFKRSAPGSPHGKNKIGVVTKYRRGVYAAVLLAFPALLFIVIARRPNFESPEAQKPGNAINAAGVPQLALSSADLAADLPHNPLSKGKAHSSFQQAANAVADLVAAEPRSVYEFHVEDIHGETVDLSKFKGQVSIVVNVASHCGYTDVNYRELQQLYSKYSSQGFVVLAFPCNQFGSQEPGSPEEIEHFVSEKYHAEFPLFQKLDVNGERAHPLYQFLKKMFGSSATAPCDSRDAQRHDIALPFCAAGMKAIPWNFQKFLIDRDGQPRQQYPSQIDPLAIEMEIVALLNTK